MPALSRIALVAERSFVREVQKPDLLLFKQINQYARAGKWNAVTNQPSRWLFGDQNKPVFEVHAKIMNENSSWVEKYPSFGRELNLVLRFVLSAVGIILVIKIYDSVVPETFRYGYKYGVKQYLEEKHRREKEGHGESSHH